LIFDLDAVGLGRVLRPWQAEAMRLLWKGYEYVSREVWEHLQGTEHAMSRAAVINFLNDMCEEGFLGYVEKTGKGGYHRVYRAKHDSEGAFRYEVAKRVREAVEKFLAEE